MSRTTSAVRDRLHADLSAAADLPYGGEAVDQLAHALQAGTLAVRAASRPAVVAAALLHDIGRSPAVAAAMPGAAHERAGAAYCAQLLGHEVSWLVGAHVLAKRALVATEPDYADTLSPVSVRSLAEQGGPASGAQLQRFLRHPPRRGCHAPTSLGRRGEGARRPDLLPRRAPGHHAAQPGEHLPVTERPFVQPDSGRVNHPTRLCTADMRKCYSDGRDQRMNS
jgi:gamma-butyrobetaine dioxygenase